MGLVSPVSAVEYEGDGTRKQFTFPFPYDDKCDVYVFLKDSTGAFRKQNMSTNIFGTYRFINDNTIEFNFAPTSTVKISRQTYSRRLIANKFEESRTDCAVVNTDCRGETDGTDGYIYVDQDEQRVRPFKVGEVLTYVSPCNEGANVYWYATPRPGISG